MSDNWNQGGWQPQQPSQQPQHHRWQQGGPAGWQGQGPAGGGQGWPGQQNSQGWQQPGWQGQQQPGWQGQQWGPQYAQPGGGPSGPSAGTIIGIVAAVFLVVILIGAVFMVFGGKKEPVPTPPPPLPLPTEPADPTPSDPTPGEDSPSGGGEVVMDSFAFDLPPGWAIRSEESDRVVIQRSGPKGVMQIESTPPTSAETLLTLAVSNFATDGTNVNTSEVTTDSAAGGSVDIASQTVTMTLSSGGGSGDVEAIVLAASGDRAGLVTVVMADRGNLEDVVDGTGPDAVLNDVIPQL